MFVGTRDNVENQSWSEDQDSGSIHSFYDITANPLDKQASGSKSDKRRRLMLESSVDSSIQEKKMYKSLCGETLHAQLMLMLLGQRLHLHLRFLQALKLPSIQTKLHYQTQGTLSFS